MGGGLTSSNTVREESPPLPEVFYHDRNTALFLPSQNKLRETLKIFPVIFQPQQTGRDREHQRINISYQLVGGVQQCGALSLSCSLSVQAQHHQHHRSCHHARDPLHCPIISLPCSNSSEKQEKKSFVIPILVFMQFLREQ